MHATYKNMSPNNSTHTYHMTYYIITKYIVHQL